MKQKSREARTNARMTVLTELMAQCTSQNHFENERNVLLFACQTDNDNNDDDGFGNEGNFVNRKMRRFPRIPEQQHFRKLEKKIATTHDKSMRHS